MLHSTIIITCFKEGSKTIKTQNIISGFDKFVFLFFFLSLVLFNNCTQNSDNNIQLEEPTSIALEANKAMEQLQWGNYANLLHPESLEYFKEMLMAGIKVEAEKVKADSLTLFGKNYAIGTFRETPNQQFFTDMMNRIFEISPELSATFKSMKNNYIGSVPDGDSLVHVLVRTSMKIGAKEIDEMNVLSLAKDQEQWKLKISTKIEGIGMIIKQNLRLK